MLIKPIDLKPAGVKVGAVGRRGPSVFLGRPTLRASRGVFLLEALIAILIFSLGLLGLVAMSAVAISAQSDAQYRAEAAKFANEILSEIWVNVDRTNAPSVVVSLATFVHQSTGTACPFAGAVSASPLVTNWQARVLATSGLPGASAAGQQILVDTTAGTGFNRVTVTVCWQAPQDRAPRRHLAIGYVN